MADIPKCTHWRGHKFEARYSIGEPFKYEFERGSAYQIATILEATKPKTYERDICVRCGHVIEKAQTGGERT